MSLDLKRRLRRGTRSVRRLLGFGPDDMRSDIPRGADVLIHVGKSGGTSLRLALKQIDLGQTIETVHIKRPPARPDLNYYIVARGPVSRAMSAFNWRHKLVVEDGTQRDRIPGEHDLLTRYSTLNALALDLYAPDGTPNAALIADFSRLHHIRENIAYYLHPLLDRIDPSQIKGVLMQENLNDDIERVFGVRVERQDKQHGQSLSDERKALEPRARANLQRFLEPDYACLLRLYCWGHIDRDVYIRTL